MNRAELIDVVFDATGLTKAQATQAVGAVLDGIAAALERGEEVRLAGFGAFSVADRPARQGRNPRTGETIPIPPTRLAKFKAGRTLREAVNADQKSAR